MLLIIIISAIILLANEVMTSSTYNCGSVTSNQCYQLCNHSSCSCGEGERLIYATCNQACAGTKCSKIICSSGTCYQSCHNCHMECTTNVDYCKQRCLSGACTFTCGAKHCVKERSGKSCPQSPFPRAYLAILAGLFAAMAILSCLALTLSCSKMDCWRQRGPYYKLQAFRGSVESLSSKTSIA